MALRWGFAAQRFFDGIAKEPGVGKCQTLTKRQLTTHKAHHEFNHIKCLWKRIGFKCRNCQVSAPMAVFSGGRRCGHLCNLRAQFEGDMAFFSNTNQTNGCLDTWHDTFANEATFIK